MDSGDLHSLREREKELNCIYRVIRILGQEDLPLGDILKKVANEIPSGWRYPGICMVGINHEGQQYTSAHFQPTRWYQRAEVVVDEHVSGEIRVYYSHNITGDEENLFLAEEQHLLNTIAEQISVFLFNRQLRYTLEYLHDEKSHSEPVALLPVSSDKHWKWRYQMAQRIAGQMDLDRFGVQAVYIIGSTKDAKAGPASDLDLLVLFDGDEWKKTMLESWIDGWSRSMAETNYQATGYRMKEGMIDLHLVTPENVKNKSNSFATMVGSLSNSARLLREKKD